MGGFATQPLPTGSQTTTSLPTQQMASPLAKGIPTQQASPMAKGVLPQQISPMAKGVPAQMPISQQQAMQSVSPMAKGTPTQVQQPTAQPEMERRDDMRREDQERFAERQAQNRMAMAGKGRGIPQHARGRVPFWLQNQTPPGLRQPPFAGGKGGFGQPVNPTQQAGASAQIPNLGIAGIYPRGS